MERIKSKVKLLFSKLKPKQITAIIIVMMIVIWLIMSGSFSINTKYFSCGSRPADIKLDVKK